MAATHAQQVLSESVLNGALSYISSLPCTTKLKCLARNPAQSTALELWETTNGLTLPSDLRDFFLSQDGFTVSWKAGHDEVGNLTIKSIAQLVRTQRSKFPSFIISSSPPFGDCYLVYVSSSEPQIWFRDIKIKWYALGYIYNTTGWQMGCTLRIETNEKNETSVQGGIPSATLDWLYLYAPERAEVYLDRQRLVSQVALRQSQGHEIEDRQPESMISFSKLRAIPQ